jgi:hypothetical protein
MKLAVVMIVLGSALGCSATSEETPASAASALGADLIGTYDFVLARSDVAAKVRAACEAKGCFEEMAKSAANEKIRFSRDAEGRLVWTSFSVDDGHEEVFVDVPIALTATERGGLAARTAGWPRGSFVGRVTHFHAALELERESDGAIVLIDPKKGRLVYRRSG